MDERKKLKLNNRIGKLLDPILILIIISLLSLGTLVVLDISPQEYTREKSNILGIKDKTHKVNIKSIYGEHKYITNEELEQISYNQFKYTALIKVHNQKVISKPIIKIYHPTSLNTVLIHTNSLKSKISLVKDKTMYVLQDENEKYVHNIKFNKGTDLYLLVENKNQIFFEQIIEIHFFLE